MIAHTFYMLLGLTVLSLIAQPPEFETYSVKFDRYIHAEDWGEIPLPLERAEQQYIRSLSTESYSIIENSIALNKIKITADLNNESELLYKVEGIHLDIEEIYDLEGIEVEKGNRKMSVGHNYFHSSFFNISTDTLSYIEVPEDLVLHFNSNRFDSRFYCEVKARNSSLFKSYVIQFSLKFTMSVIGNPGERVVMESDRKYFIAVL